MAYIPTNQETVIKNLNPSATRNYKEAPLGAYDAFYNSNQRALSKGEREIQGAIGMADRVAQAFAQKIQEDEDIQANNGYQLDKGVFQADIQKRISETADPKQWTEVFKQGYMDFQNQVYEKYSDKMSRKQMQKVNGDLTGIYTQGLKHWTGQGIRQIRADSIASSNASLKTIANSDMDVSNKMASIDQILNTLEDSGHITPEGKQTMRDGWEKEAFVNDAIKRVTADPEYNDWKDNPLFGKIEKDAITSAQKQAKREQKMREYEINKEAYDKASDDISNPKFTGYSSQAQLKIDHPNLTDTQAKRLYDASEAIIKARTDHEIVAERSSNKYFQSLYNMVNSIDSKNIADYKAVYDGLYKAPSSVKTIINKLITDKVKKDSPVNKIPTDIKTAYDTMQESIKKDIKTYKYIKPTSKNFYDFVPSTEPKSEEQKDEVDFWGLTGADQYYNPQTKKRYTNEELQTLADKRTNNFYKLINGVRELALKDGMTLDKFTEESRKMYNQYKTGQTLDRINAQQTNKNQIMFYVNYGNKRKGITPEIWKRATPQEKEQLKKMRVK